MIGIKFLLKNSWLKLIFLAFVSFYLCIIATDIHLLFKEPVSHLSDQVLVEYFPKANHLPWQVQNSSLTQGIGFYPRTWQNRLQELWLDRPGLHFEARTTEAYKSQTIDAASIPWAIGTRPFHFSSTVVIDRGNQQNWFEPGLGISLATAPPEQMGEQDFAITFALQQAGVTPGVRQGKVFQLNPSNEHQLADEVLSSFIPPIEYRIHALDYPQLWLDGIKLRLEVTRTSDSWLKFVIFDLNRPNTSDPIWWSGEYQLPDRLASQPLRYVTLQRIPVTAGHIGYPNFQITGRVTALQGYALDADPPPQVYSYTAQNPVLKGGDLIAVQGNHFQPGLKAWIGNKPAPVVWESQSQIQLKLPPHSSGRQPLLVENSNGLRDKFTPGIAYGRLLESIEPYEVSPQGGDRVQLIGSGFTPDTQVWIDQQNAQVVDYKDTSHLWVKIPLGTIGSHTVRVQTSGLFPRSFQGQAQLTYAPHPYLLGNQEFLDAAQDRLSQSEWKTYNEVINSQFQAALNAPLPENANPNEAATLEALTWAYAWTGERIYSDRLREWLKFKWKETNTSEFHAMTVSAMAIAYDVLFKSWSPQERQYFLEYLHRALNTYLRDREAKLWFLGSDGALQVNGSNTVAVGNAGGGLAALALQYSHPKPTHKAIREATTWERYFIGYSLMPDGGAVEGSLYWNYGLGYYLLFAHALAASTGDDRGLLNHPHLLQTLRYVETVWGADGTFLTFNDTQPFFTGGLILADLGNRLADPLLLWLADYGMKLRSGQNPSAIHVNLGSPFWMFLWRGEIPAPEKFPGLHTLSTLEDLQLGVLRSDQSASPEFLLGLKGGGGNLTHHAQPDVGSFILQVSGETLLLDPGYYQPSSTSHNLLLLDDVGPQVLGGVLVESQEQGDWRTVTIDATRAYSHKHFLQPEELSNIGIQASESTKNLSCPAKVRRVFVMSGDDAIVILDDVAVGESPSPDSGTKPGTTVHTLLQSNGRPIAVSENSWTIQGSKSAIGVRFFPPEESRVEASQVDREFGASWLFEMLAQARSMDWHTLRLSYPHQATVPSVMVLTNLSQLQPDQVSLSRSPQEIHLLSGSRTLAKFKLSDGYWHAQNL